VLVVIGSCTHLGCSPTPRFEFGADDLGADWPGGFFCACHGSKFDLSGRVFAGVPAPLNLVVPPHKYVDESTILVGEDEEVA
jgi:ubiquinol-cytochrome c reductase iron-sulfur subunit